jgi:hypothetical protein
MGGMMGFGWLGALLVLGLVVAAIAWGVSQLTKSEGTPAKVSLTILAVVGGIALVVLLGVSFMHAGMMGGVMNCC